MATNAILSLDIGTSTLKMAEFQTTQTKGLILSEFAVHTSIAKPGESEQEDNLIRRLTELIAKRKWSTNRVAVSVSAQSVFTRFDKLPVTDEEKIRQMMQIQAQENVPFPLEEVVWDYQLIGEESGAENVSFVLVAIKAEIIEKVFEQVESVGLKPVTVDVAPLALYNAVSYNYSDEEGCTLVLDIGARTTNLIFVEPRKVFTRTVPIAGNTITQGIVTEFDSTFEKAEDLKIREGFVGLGGAYEEPELESAARLSKIIRNSMTRLHAEVARSIALYKTQQNGNDPKRILMAGGTSMISYLDYFFKEKLDVPVEFFNPFKSVAVSDRINKDKLSMSAHLLGEVVGLGLRQVIECPVEVNLIPKTVIKRQQLSGRIPFFAMTLAAVVVLIWMFFFYFHRATSLRAAQLIQVKNDVSNLQNSEKKLLDQEKTRGELEAKLSQISGLVGRKNFWLKFIDELNGQIPEEIWIVLLDPRRDGQSIGRGATSTTVERAARRGRRGRAEEPSGVGPGAPPGSAPTEAGAADTLVISEFFIKGICLNHPDKQSPLVIVDKFAQNLRQSEHFGSTAEDVKIDYIGNPLPESWAVSFTIKAKLKNPQALR